MPEFKCTVCSQSFSVGEEILNKYPGWTPKYCLKHRPEKQGAARSKKPAVINPGVSGELDLPLSEVLARFSAGPQTGIFTDGSARPNPGPGGWGMVYVKNGQIIDQKYGSEAHTTNNRMELTALIEAFTRVPAEEAITIYSDSELCVKTITIWAAGWERQGWRRKSGPIKNLELVQQLYDLKKARPLAKLEWIEAHNGWLWNEYADSLATAWARNEL